MKYAILKVLILSLLFSNAATAQSAAPTELAGARFLGPTNPVVDSNATFAIGLVRDGQSTYQTSATVADTVRIVGRVRPEPEHVGLRADIFMVDRVNLAFTMKTQDGGFIPWNGMVANLVPFREDVILAADMEMDLFAGTLGVGGDHRIFIGYLPETGILRYTPVPHRLDITSQSATSQAYSLFVSAISPNIVQTRCIACHVTGGLAEAGGAYHIFKQPLDSNLATNFEIFQGLIALRGVDYVLTKVTGGNNHGGSVQLAAGSADYLDLQNFVTLMAQDLPPPTNPNPGADPDPYDSENPYGY